MLWAPTRQELPCVIINLAHRADKRGFIESQASGAAKCKPGVRKV